MHRGDDLRSLNRNSLNCRMLVENTTRQEATMRARPNAIRALLIAGVAVCAIATPLIIFM
jgi:hypothetical protein